MSASLPGMLPCVCDLGNYFHGRHNCLHLKAWHPWSGRVLVISEGIVEFHCCDEQSSPPTPLPALHASPLISLNGEAQRASVGSRSLDWLNVEFVYFA